MKDRPEYAALRRKAERIAKNADDPGGEGAQFDILRLAHEMEVAHVELEARNEQLREVSRELELSRSEFFDLYESAPVAFVTLSSKGLISRTNEAARKMLPDADGYLSGVGFSFCVLPGDRQVYFRKLKELAVKGKPGSFELRLRDGKGGCRHVHIQAAAKYDAEKNFSHWSLAFFDVTDQKRLEAELRKSREHLALATQTGGIGIWMQDLRTRKSTWNRQLYRMLGLSPRKGPEEGDAFFAYIHPEDRKGVLRNTGSLLKSGDEIDLEFRIIRADGHIRWLTARGMVERNEAGDPFLLRGVNFDITDRKRNEIALQENRERFRSVLEHSLDVSFRRNMQTQRYDYISPVIEEITGFSKAEIGEMSSEDLMGLVHPEDRVRINAVMEKARKSGKGKIDFRFRKKDGKYLWMADHFTLQMDAEGRPLYRIGVLRDVTEKKKTEQELEAKNRMLSEKLLELEKSNIELSEYAYVVSHDLKAPLRAVRNYADFLMEDLEDRLPDEQKTYLEGIKKATVQGNELIHDLLSFAGIGQDPETPEPIDLKQLVQEVCSSLAMPKEAQVTVTDRCPSFSADRRLLKQLLSNLIANGIKFNESVDKRVEVGCRMSSYDRIELTVKDNGIGIEERYRDQVFRVFQRLHTATEYDGTGIGLAIVRKAAMAMGGAVDFESSPGKGSTFVVNLPKRPEGVRKKDDGG